jgi:hypothetical protein
LVYIFPIFLRFSTEFTRISKTHKLFEIHFCDQAPDSFDSSRRYPRFTQNTPRRRRKTQLGPRGPPVAVLIGIRRGQRCSWTGKGRRGILGSPELDLCAWLGKKGCRRGWTAAPSGGRRGSGCSSEKTGASGTQGARGARVVQGRGAKDVAGLCECIEGTPQWRRRARRSDNGMRE